MRLRKFKICCVLAALIAGPLTAQENPKTEIFKWVDEEGNTHYSSKPRNSYDQPAKLPAIQRESLSAKITDLKAKTPPNCESHGGVDCGAGPDKDQSVICRDGFAESTLPFSLSCMEADLSADKLDVIDDGDQVLSTGRLTLKSKIKMLRVGVRNNSDVTAKDVKVRVRFGVKKPVEFQGPSEIQSYGFAEYLLPYDDLSPKPYLLELKKSEVSVYCPNCR